MKTASKVFEYKTKGELEFMDVTDDIAEFLKKSKIKNGLLNVQCMHSTSALILNETDPLLLDDFRQNLNNCAPKEISYNHDDFGRRTQNITVGECENGHSHCKAIHLNATLCVNVINGKIQLGDWQRIIFVELDRARTRHIQVVIIGE